MNEHQVKGKLKEAAGATQEQVGKATNNREQASRGQAREQEGKVQKKVGDVKQGIEKIIRRP